MRAYLKIKKIDCPIDTGTVIRDELPQKNKDYTLLIPVALKSKELTQVEADDEDEEVYYYMDVTGDPRLIPADFGTVEKETDEQPASPLSEDYNTAVSSPRRNDPESFEDETPNLQPEGN